MKVTVTTLSDDIFTIEVSDDMELENFKALCEFESGVPSQEISISLNGRVLEDDKKQLKDYGVTDGEVLLLQRIRASANTGATQQQGTPAGLGGLDFSSIQVPQSTNSGGASTSSASGANPEDPSVIRDMLLNSPHDLAILKERNPPLADALLSGDLAKFTEVLRKQQGERADRDRERIRMINADPFDAEVQQKIAEEIRLKNVESNMETAMEYAPESFGQVVMLYIDCKVNGQPVKAFVDSGAQMTIMSQACAERCHIMRLVDRRWAGIAKGVGTQKIIGRVHLCQIQIGPDFLQSSFSILEEQPMDMLLGLDMLKRHQCSIDLKNNRLVIGTTGTETPFLNEMDLPEHARLNRQLSGMDVDEDRQLAEALAKSAEDNDTTVKSNGASTSAASTSTSSGARPSPPKPSSSTADFPEVDIKKLMDYGFSRQRVVEELTKARGNLDQALAALFAKSFQMPS